MKSSEKLRLLLDSTYLLPILGVEVEGIRNTLILLKKLRDKGKTEYYYTPFNLFEIIGKLSKLRYDLDTVATGLTAIEEEFKLAQPAREGYLKALTLRARGHRDLIDLLLYTTSKTENIMFLTRDYTLIDFLKENHEDLSNILDEKIFLKRYADNPHERSSERNR